MEKSNRKLALGLAVLLLAGNVMYKNNEEKGHVEQIMSDYSYSESPLTNLYEDYSGWHLMEVRGVNGGMKLFDKEPDNDEYVYIPTGTKMLVNFDDYSLGRDGKAGSYYRLAVDSNGNLGYIDDYYLLPVEPVKYYRVDGENEDVIYNNNSVNVRTRPDSTSGLMTTISSDTALIVDEIVENGEWAHVYFCELDYDDYDGKSTYDHHRAMYEASLDQYDSFEDYCEKNNYIPYYMDSEGMAERAHASMSGLYVYDAYLWSGYVATKYLIEANLQNNDNSYVYKKYRNQL